MFTTAKIDTGALKEEFRKELVSNILPYWTSRMVDEENGGFYGRRDAYDRLEPKADKGITLNTRILWTFSHAALALDEPYYRRIADRAYHFIIRHFLDPKFLGVYWTVDFQGRPVDSKKQVFAQAFAIYTFVEYFKATGKKESLEHAIDIFRLIEKYGFDADNNGYFEAFNQEWKLWDDPRQTDKNVNETKTMHTHLHMLEAYTNLYSVWKDGQLGKQLRNLLMVFLGKMINETNHFNLFFDKAWKVKSHTTSYGHDMQGSWVLFQAAKVGSDRRLLEKVKPLCLSLVEQVFKQGFDDDGALMYGANESGLSEADKHWWPQAEALVGLVNAWQLSADDKYLEAAVRTWRFIQSNLIDKEYGEWHGRVDGRGVIDRNEDKAGPSKCPLHNGRAMLELIRRLP
jgi:mannobiose 2-epimerase